MPTTVPIAAFLAVDLGSSNGRVMLGLLDAYARRMTVREVARFPNREVAARQGIGWDLVGLWDHVVEGIAAGCAAAAAEGAPVRGIAVDSWGVDYARRRTDGGLRAFARHHRGVDVRFAAAASAGRDAARDYATTGVLDQAINTSHQVRQDARDGIGSDDDVLLLIADAFVYLLTGAIAAERSLASTTALVDRSLGDWSPELTAGIRGVLPPLLDAGALAGHTSPAVTARIGAAEPLPVWRVTAHDTAAAFSAVVSAEEGKALTGVVACGSWAVAGVGLREPILTEAARDRGFTQEIGAEGATLLVKNLSGMWLLQQAAREWAALGEGGKVDLPALLAAAAESDYSGRFDPGDTALQTPGGLVPRLVERCAADAATPPTTRADLVRAILSSLADAYARTVADIEELTGHRIERLRLVGGGSRGDLLAALTAAAAERPVDAGPAEASARGILLQSAVAAGFIPDLATARTIELDDGEPPTREFLPYGDRAPASRTTGGA